MLFVNIRTCYFILVESLYMKQGSNVFVLIPNSMGGDILPDNLSVRFGFKCTAIIRFCDQVIPIGQSLICATGF